MILKQLPSQESNLAKCENFTYYLLKLSNNSTMTNTTYWIQNLNFGLNVSFTGGYLW